MNISGKELRPYSLPQFDNILSMHTKHKEPFLKSPEIYKCRIQAESRWHTIEHSRWGTRHTIHNRVHNEELSYYSYSLTLLPHHVLRSPLILSFSPFF